jgi:radical SAM superfamily enzyme YgiQ (UPF0313 family)
MAKILFVERSLRVDKLGILFLSSALKTHGHQVDLVQENDGIEDRIEEYCPDFVMYSIMTGEHVWFIEKNGDLKRKFEFTSVFGGPHPTFFPEQSESDPNVDYIVRGPAEQTIVELVEGKHNQKVITSCLPMSLDDIVSPDRSILYKYEEFKNSGIRRFIGSRDCKNACAYCFNHIFHRLFKDQKQAFFKRISPSKLVDEIIDVKNKYGLSMTYMNDDNLAEDHEWLNKFCNEYKERVYAPFKINFCGSVRADSSSRDILSEMSKAGCSFLNIALESVSKESQTLLRRGRITNEDVEKACNSCKEFGIKVRLQNMIGLPVNDPLGDALDTFEYNKKIDPEDSWASIFQPFPKTDLWKYCLKHDFITEKDECMNFYDDTILKIKDAEKINSLHKWWHFAVKCKIPTEFLELLLEIPLTDAQKVKIQNLRWKLAAKSLYGE